MPTIIDPASKAGARALERLEAELIGWLTTTNPDRQPQSSPIWFQWTGDEVLVYSGKRAPRNGNVPDRPLVSFNLNTDSVGGDVVTMEGEARIDPAYAPAHENPAYVAKYQGLLDEYGWTAEYFAGEYPVAILVRPTRWRLG
ncbi:MAG: pyridoxamine 5'-phosphate oxidase family protein [Candidatus Limnocylindrales bacterium]